MPLLRIRRHSDRSVSITGRILGLPIRHRIPPGRYGPRFWLVLLCVYALGGVTGGFVMWNRARANDVVAVINGVPIVASRLHVRLEQGAGPETLTQIVNEEMIFQFARKKRAEPTDVAVRRRAAELHKEYTANHKAPPATAGSESMLRLARLQLIRETLWGKGITVTEADALAYYRRHSDPDNPNARFFTPERIDAGVIVCPAEKDIRKAWQELQAGRPFADVARKYSKDHTARQGGQVTFTLHGRNPLSHLPAFDSRMFTLRVGEQMEPTRFGGVWWAARCLARSEAVTVPYEKVKEQCFAGAREALGASAHAAEVEAEAAAFRGTSNIQVFWPQYYDLARTWR